jgi:predicted TIM-barrel fold metal-dependent hydrolase
MTLWPIWQRRTRRFCLEQVCILIVTTPWLNWNASLAAGALPDQNGSQAPRISSRIIRAVWNSTKTLAHFQIPLLCHTGVEHTLKAFPNTLNDPRRLLPALERGVTVIAAHCGTRIFLHEKSYLKTWREMALKHEHFYGDISAFGVVTRLWLLGHLLKSPALTAKLVFGSDFPHPTKCH